VTAGVHAFRHAPVGDAAGDVGREGERRRVNVLLLASALWIGGAETVIRHLAAWLDRRRFNVSVVCLKQRGHIGDELARQGIDITAFQPTGQEAAVDYFTFWKLRRLVRAKRIDVIHTHTAHGLVDATLCKLLVPGLKVVHTFHFGNYPHTRRRVMWMERLCSRLVTRVFAVGQEQRAQLRRVYRFADRSIGAIWNGVVLPTLPGDQSFRARIGAEHTLLVGTIATLIEQKGLRDVMRVASRLRRFNVRFVIVGEGALRGELEALRSELGLDDVVQLSGWQTNAADVALPSFDIFFQPSLWEAMSVVTLEAMAAGKPVVTTRVGEAAHIIEDGVEGVLVAPADVDAMTEALARLIEDPALRASMGAAARARVERQLTVAHMTRAYEQVYLDVVGER
jgi:glycosyltransferase involved in cell wall biosynthesis